MDVVCGQMKPDLASKIIDCARVVVKTEPIPMSPQTRSEDLARKFGGTPVTALAQRVRAAYPSAYDDLLDKELLRNNFSILYLVNTKLCHIHGPTLFHSNIQPHGTAK